MGRMMIVAAFLGFASEALAQPETMPPTASAPVASPMSAWRNLYQTTWRAAQFEDSEGNWEKALGYYEKCVELIPNEPVSRFNVARMHARMGKDEAALAELKKSIDLGWCDEEALLKEPAFAGLVMMPEFKPLQDRARAVEGERILVHVPPKLDPSRPAPLIVALHSRGEGPHLHLPTWQAAADELGAVIVAPRAPKRGVTKLLNLWDSAAPREPGMAMAVDISAAQNIVEEAIKLAESKQKIDDRRIVLAGNSQGGQVALELLATQPERFAGVFTLGALYRSDPARDWKKAAARRRVRCVLLAGELELTARTQTEQAVRELKDAGIEVEYTELKGVGAEPPADLTRRQADGIKFLLR